ncbi:MAG: UDP-N-acetylglucosamine 2-epimerase (non-hydrolyzing) [Actinomycetota bacterium]
MGKLKVMTVFGTRPEAIKLAPVIKELEKQPEKFQTVVVVTAQHREMLDQVLNLFEITPDYDLNIMQPEQELFDIATKSLAGLKPILEKEKPDILLVQGDTSTTFFVALTAFYLKIPIGHVEAGLRTKDKYHPFPEEINRRLTSHLADIHFAPTETAKKNLIVEGITPESIHVTGNTVIDALLATVKKEYSFDQPPLSEVDFSKKVITVTAHRRESWGAPLNNICEAVKKIVETNPDVEVVFSVHLSPKVQEAAKKILGSSERVHLVAPLDYVPFVHLMNKSYLILTDSGGIQEEAPSLGKPVLVMREVTERPEAIEAGTAKLVGRSTDKIIAETSLLLNNKDEYQKMAQAKNPYGDGKASERIIELLQVR